MRRRRRVEERREIECLRLHEGLEHFLGGGCESAWTLSFSLFLFLFFYKFFNRFFNLSKNRTLFVRMFSDVFVELCEMGIKCI